MNEQTEPRCSKGDSLRRLSLRGFGKLQHFSHCFLSLRGTFPLETCPVKCISLSLSLPRDLSPVLGSFYPQALTREASVGLLSQPTPYVGEGLYSAHLSRARVILLDGPNDLWIRTSGL